MELCVNSFPLENKVIYAGIFPDNNPFSIPSSNRKRYRKSRNKRRLTTNNLRKSSKYIKIVENIKKIISAKKKGNQYSELLTYWQIGEKVAKVTSDREKSKEFNKKLFKLLSFDCKISLDSIYNSVKFYRVFPILSDVSPNLTWNHYINLITIDNENLRNRFHKLSVDKKLSVSELKKLIKQK